MRRTGIMRSTAANSSCATSPIRCPTAVGSESVCDREIVVQSAKRTLMAMVDASQPLRAEPRAHLVGESAKLGPEHSVVRDVHVECLFVPHALVDAMRVDVARIDAAGEMPDTVAHRRTERSLEHRQGRVEHIGDGVDASALQ